MVDFEQWEGFEGSLWKEEVNVRDFIQKKFQVSPLTVRVTSAKLIRT